MADGFQQNRLSIWDLGGTLNEMDPPGEAPPRDVIECVNWKVHEDGKSRIKRPGYVKHDTDYSFGGEAIRGIFDFIDSGLKYTVVVTSNKVWVYKHSTTTWTEVYSQVDALTEPTKPVVFESGRPIIVGFDSNLSIEPAVSYQLGITAPASACTAAAGVAGVLTGTYSYRITYYRSGNYPCESNPSDISNEVVLAAEKADLTDIPTSSDPKVDTRRIYRTTAGGAIYYWLADIPDNVTTIYTDNITDDVLLGGDAISYDRGVPPVGDYIEIWDNRAWIAVASENKIYYTNTNTVDEMATLNFFPIKSRLPGNLKGMRVFGDELYIFKDKLTFKISKIGDALYEFNQLPVDVGCDAPASIAVGDNLMVWKSQHGIEIFNGSNFLRPIISRHTQRTMDSINNTYILKSFGEINEKEAEYWLSIPTGSNTEPDKTIVLDLLKGSLTVYEFAKNMTAFYNKKDSDDNLVFTSGSSDGHFYVQGSGYHDGGTAIEANFKTIFFPITEEREVWNRLRRVFVKYILEGNSSIALRVYADFKRREDLMVLLPGSILYSDVETRKEIIQRVNLAVKATHVCLEFINDDIITGECRVIGFDGYYDKGSWNRRVSGERI